MGKLKFQPGQTVIVTSKFIPEEVTIAQVEPRKWWHLHQRYLIESVLEGHYTRYTENHLIAKAPTGGKKNG